MVRSYSQVALIVGICLLLSGIALAKDPFDSQDLWNGHGPDVDFDLNGNLHMVWADGHYVRYTEAERQADGTFQFWPIEAAIQVEGSNGASGYRYGLPRIAVDRDGGSHIAWVNSQLNELFYAYVKDGQTLWTGKIKSSYPKYLGNTDIEVDYQGRAYIAYQNPKMGHPYGMGVICMKVGEGTLWDRIMQPIDSGEEKYPALVLNSFQPIGPQNPLYVFWKEVHHFAKYDGSNWTEAKSIPEVPQFNGRVDINIDSQNRPVLCYLNWITGGNWWIEGIYVKTCKDYGDNWNQAQKVSSVDEIIFRSDYSPTAPDIGINAAGDMVVTWNHNGVLQYNVFTNGQWMEESKDLGYCNINTSEGGNTVGTGDIVVFHENQSNHIFFNQFTFNQPPSVLLGGFTSREVNPQGYNIGGDFNMLAIIEDANGMDDIASVQAIDPDDFTPLFNLYDDGLHGDFLPNDTIYGSVLGDEFENPGERQLVLIQAKDHSGTSSDIYPFVTIHGNGGSATMAPENIPRERTWSDQYAQMAADSSGEWMVYMGGYMNSHLGVGIDAWFDIIAWVLPVNAIPACGISRVELCFEDVPVMELPLMMKDSEWGRFYGVSLPIPGDAFTSDFANLMMLFQIRAIDENGHPGPCWPYIELAPEPTPTPEPTATVTPRPTIPPLPTNTPRPTNPPFPTNTPHPTNPPFPTSTPTPEPTATWTPTDTPQPTVTNTPMLP